MAPNPIILRYHFGTFVHQGVKAIHTSNLSKQRVECSRSNDSCRFGNKSKEIEHVQLSATCCSLRHDGVFGPLILEFNCTVTCSILDSPLKLSNRTQSLTLSSLRDRKSLLFKQRTDENNWQSPV